jgi:NAD-dependent SIR2 family protein deacetylase
VTDSPVLNLHNSLRQAKERWAVLLGAGASYDYGIPTMSESATILRGQIRDGKPDGGITQPTLDLLRTLCPEQGGPDWNIEDLLTRLSQLLDAGETAHASFAPVTAAVGTTPIPAATVRQASEELIGFMARMCDLSSYKHMGRGAGQVDYLADFLSAMAGFGKPASRLIRIFSTNIDLCIEAALVRLSQRPRVERRPDLVLVDGFEGTLLPTFNMRCYKRDTASLGDRCVVCYWKLHGSIDWTYSQAIGTDTSAEGVYSDQSIIVRRVDENLWNELAHCGALSATQPAGSSRIVIFPTPAKYSQTYTFPYMDMFEAFRRTLEEIELLICIGTSFPDQHIRSALRSFVERDNTLLFVVDPQPHLENLRRFFGDSRAVQPVITMGFSDFVREFKTLEAATGAMKATEAVQ